MRIALSRDSDVPIRQQLAEQIVFLITTGTLRAGTELPSVRTLARQLEIHHNTVSEAYQELVGRGWLNRRSGSRLTVGQSRPQPNGMPSLDELINETIRRARENGFSLQMLQRRVRERFFAEPPDHVLVVEDEDGLRTILCREVADAVAWPVRGCSLRQLRADPSLGVGAQALAPTHVAEAVKGWVAPNRPPVAVNYSDAGLHLETIRSLERPSIVVVASVSESLLKTARSLLAPALARMHVLREILVSGAESVQEPGADIVICDALTMSRVKSGHKFCYRLIPRSCLDDLAAALNPQA